MVLPVRIELTTSALPRMRSTTELRQHFVRRWRAYDGAALRLSTRLAANRRERHVVGMAAKDKAKARAREERLAAALRENLRRRKAQARALKSGGQERADDKA